MIGIYKITNPNKEAYIGQTTNIDNRENSYKTNNCKSQPKIYNSIKLYNWDNHIFEVLEICDLDKLDELETYYKTKFIEKFGWEKALFCNLIDGRRGFKSEEAKLKMGLSKKGNKFRLGTKHSDETKEKMKLAKIGFKMSDETKEKISNSKKGVKSNRILSEEAKTKISETHKGNKYNLGRISTEESNKKRSIAMKGKYLGRILSEETKEKMRKPHKPHKKWKKNL